MWSQGLVLAPISEGRGKCLICMADHGLDLWNGSSASQQEMLHPKCIGSEKIIKSSVLKAWDKFLGAYLGHVSVTTEDPR